MVKYLLIFQQVVLDVREQSKKKTIKPNIYTTNNKKNKINRTVPKTLELQLD
jgi:hypothetical protein